MSLKKLLVVLTIALLVAWHAKVSQAEKPKIGSSEMTVVALGSSTTAPRGSLVVYADILRKSLPELGIQGQVINAGVPADTTKLALDRFEKDVLRHGPSLVIIQLGINDSAFDVWKDPPAEGPRVSLADYEKNLRQMVETLKRNEVAVILMTPNPLAWTDKLRELYGKPPYDPEDEDGFNVLLKEYVAIVKQLGEEEKVPVIDVFEAFRTQKDGTVNDLLLDGMHPNDRGHRLVADLLLEQIASMKEQIKPSIYGERIHAKATELPHSHLGPFVTLDEGIIMAPDSQSIQISNDGGKTWTSHPVFSDNSKFKISDERVTLRTKKGTLLIMFMNMAELRFQWDDKRGGPLPECYLPAYVICSVDNGKTWSEPQKIQDGWCGAVRSILQTRDGRIVAAVEKALPNPGRHVMYSYFSDDEGLTWKQSNAIDIGKPGGYGDHGGTMEGTIVELTDGRIYHLLRTNTGYFWETYSEDGGQTWQEPKQSNVVASSSPAILQRLASGRIVMIWNRYRDPAQQFGRRDTLHMAFSDDECKSWSEPVAIATNIVPPDQVQQKYRQSYPYVFEYKPGQLWITTMQGMVRMSLSEEDFVE